MCCLLDKHVALGAKMVPFAGFDMPLQYTGLAPEHHAVRNSVGCNAILFDAVESVDIV
ncbi:MAG: hypothetical protein O3C19_06670, partial [Bacteroidetes bacterium]|nr:hypothetical protein [Bacteroidota bacterium]